MTSQSNSAKAASIDRWGRIAWIAMLALLVVAPVLGVYPRHLMTAMTRGVAAPRMGRAPKQYSISMP